MGVNFLAEWAGILVIGFSLISAALLFTAYILFLPFQRKTWFSLASCALLLIAVSMLQIGHLQYFRGGFEPFDSSVYVFALFLIPPSFFYFCRTILFPDAPIRPLLAIHLLPILLFFFVRREIAIPILYLIGSGHCVWLATVTYGLREQRNQISFALFFFVMFTLIALTILILGFSIPYIDSAYFYYFYCFSIGLTFMLVIFALIAFPTLIDDISNAARVRYSVSTLGGVDKGLCLEKLDRLMRTEKVFQDENLNLRQVAEMLELSSHQLSELINTQLGMSFSKFVRQQRIEAAKAILIREPDLSVLSVGLETGFKSQSNFHTVFREITGQSPGDFRKAKSDF